ncbi:MAG: TonB-dependent receptor [Pseudomonadota bacterium]
MSAGAARAAAPAADAPAAAEAPAADAFADAGSGLEEITVTATKRETNLQATPISISVLGGEAIKDRKVQSLLDLADGGIPSLRVATFEARQSALTIGIRGIVPLDANQPAREQGVGIYIDGIYLGRQHGLNASLFDIERVEVLKGPQGTLFGRNTEGGALSLVSKAPTGEFGGRLEGGIGNLGAYNGAVHLDLPKFGGFSVKLDGVIQHQDETTTNPLAGQIGWGYYNRKGGRVAVRWEIADGITNDFSYDVAKDENTPFYSQLLNYDPNNCRALNGGSTTGTTNPIPAGSTCVAPGTAFTSVSGTVRPTLPGVVVNGTSLQRVADIGVPQQVSVDKTHGFTNALKWKLAPEIELRSFTAWRGVDVEQWDNSGGAHRVPVVAPGCTGTACNFSRYSLADLRQRQFSQEFQAVGTIGSVDYVAGLFYFNEHISDDAATPSSVAISGYTTAGQTTGYTYTPLVPCPAGAPAAAGTVGPATNGCSIDRASEVWSKSYAAFAQVTWNATDALHITAGGRYTVDQKRGVLHWSRGLNYDTATAAQLTTAGYAPLDKEWKRFNPMVTVAYDFDRDIHAYAKYATGYRAGGASSRTQNYQAFNPEDVTSYEIGLKADFWNRRARFNIAGYIMDRKDSQVDLSTIQPFNGSAFNNLVTFNAPGTTKIQGIEADFSVKPMDGLTLNASYAYTYTDVPLVPVTYTEFSATGVPTGNTTTVNQKFYIVFTPRNAASGSIDYELPIGGTSAKIKLHLDANYSQATQSFDQFAITNDASFIVNGRINVAGVSFGDNNDQSLTFGIWGRNLFDYQYVYRRDPSNSIPQVQSNRAAATTAPNLLLVGNIGNTIGDYGNFNLPRTFGVDATLKF